MTWRRPVLDPLLKDRAHGFRGSEPSDPGMIERARAAGVTLVVAHTLPESNASTSVLERCGFVRTATDASDEDGDVEGDVWCWEHVVS